MRHAEAGFSAEAPSVLAAVMHMLSDALCKDSRRHHSNLGTTTRPLGLLPPLIEVTLQYGSPQTELVPTALLLSAGVATCPLAQGLHSFAASHGHWRLFQRLLFSCWDGLPFHELLHR